MSAVGLGWIGSECAMRQIRNVFETILKYGHDEDFAPVAGNDFKPTDAPAGSKAKIETLARRIEMGMPLWHPEDRHDYSGLTGVVRPRD
jgi:hypothetical protein